MTHTRNDSILPPVAKTRPGPSTPRGWWRWWIDGRRNTQCCRRWGTAQQGAVAGNYAKQTEHQGEGQQTRLHSTCSLPSQTATFVTDCERLIGCQVRWPNHLTDHLSVPHSIQWSQNRTTSDVTSLTEPYQTLPNLTEPYRQKENPGWNTSSTSSWGSEYCFNRNIYHHISALCPERKGMVQLATYSSNLTIHMEKIARHNVGRMMVDTGSTQTMVHCQWILDDVFTGHKKTFLTFTEPSMILLITTVQTTVDGRVDLESRHTQGFMLQCPAKQRHFGHPEAGRWVWTTGADTGSED